MINNSNYLNLKGTKIIDGEENNSFFYRNCVLDKYKTIYFVLPKCACTSILLACVDLLDDPKFDRGFIHLNNYPSASLEEIFRKYNHYLKFTFVRNPWDRVVSCYREKIANPDPNKFPNAVTDWLSKLNVYQPGMSFDDFVKVISEILDAKSDPHFRSQYTFMMDKNNNFFIDYVGKVETLQENFTEICNLIGAKNISLQHINKSLFASDKKYQDFYTDETKELIAKRYSIDINLFGYSFD